MNEYSEISFQYYPARVNTNRPLGAISLEHFLISTKSPKDSTKAIFNQIAAAELSGDKKLKGELKQNHLFYFTPCVYVHPFRRYACIKHFTGLLALDFDHIDNARDFKYFLFDEYKSVLAAWLSPSKCGLKCLVKIPKVNTVEEFKEYYFGIASEMEVYNGFDPSGQNAVLPLFQSWDMELLSRNYADTWTIKGINRRSFTTSPVIDKPVIVVTDKDKETIIKIIDTGFNNIIDYGHPPLISLCVAIGGYVATGYISEYEALSQVNYNIETHPYLKKGISGYKKSALSAINKGQEKPLLLNYRVNG